MFVGFNVGYVCIGMAGYAVEIAELTIGNTYVGRIHIAVNDPRYFAMQNLYFSTLVGYKT